MQLLTNSQIDFEKWDRAVLSSRYPFVFAQSFYLNATSPGWKALIKGDYESIMPLTAKRKLGIDYLAQPPFTSQLGVYGKCNAAISESFEDFITSRYRFIEIEVNPQTEFSGKEKKTYMLDLRYPYSFNDNTRRNIAKAKRSGLTVKKISNTDLPSLSRNYFHPFLKSLKISSSHIKTFDKLLSSCTEAKKLTTLGAYNGSTLCALAVFISNGVHALYLKGVNLDKNSGAMHLLMEQALADYAKRHVQHFDFGGGNTESLARFYSGFDARPFYYSFYKHNSLPLPLKLFKK